MRLTRLSLLFSLAVLALPATAAQAVAPREPFFPRAGNPGYDALHYHVRLHYRSGGSVRSSVAMTAVATAPLDRLSLDFFGPRVGKVMVNGSEVAFGHGKGKLRARLTAPIATGTSFEVVVRYQGVPPTIIDPDSLEEGWIPTYDGALATGEPQGTAAWIPCNNIPADKATFAFDLTVPGDLKAVANGRLTEVRRLGKRKLSAGWKTTR